MAQDLIDVTGRISIKGKNPKNNADTVYHKQYIDVLFFKNKKDAQECIKTHPVKPDTISFRTIPTLFTNTATEADGTYRQSVMDGFYIVIYHPDSRREPRLLGPVTKRKSKFDVSFETGSIEIQSVTVHGKRKRQMGTRAQKTRVYGENITFTVNFEVAPGMGGDNKRLIIQPYVISCTNDEDTVACLDAIVVEGKEYHELQNKRKGYKYNPNDPLHHFYIDSLVLDDKYLNVKKTLTYNRGNTNKMYYCSGPVIIEDYTHCSYYNPGDTIFFGSCYAFDPLKLLEFKLTNTELPLTEEFYDPPRAQFREVSEILELKFENGKAVLTTDSINTITSQRLARTLRSYGPKLLQVKVEGTSSPEGGFELNSNLAARRAQTTMAQIQRYTIGVDCRPVITHKVYTWFDVADSLQRRGYADLSKQIRDAAVRHGEYHRSIHAIAKKDQPLYDSIIKPILANQRTVSCSYMYQNNSPLTAEEALDCWYHNPEYKEGGTKFFSDGDYYNILTLMKDPVEQRRVIERAHKEITRGSSYHTKSFAAYLANRMAIYKLADGYIDTTLLQRFIDTSYVADFPMAYGPNLEFKWIVNRSPLVANQALMYLKKNNLPMANYLIDMLDDSHAALKDEVRTFSALVERIMYWDDPTVSDSVRMAGDMAIQRMVESSQINAAVLNTELFDELHGDYGSHIDVMQRYVDPLPDTDAKKWYLKGIHMCHYVGYEADSLAAANATLQSILEAYNNGLRADSLNADNVHLYRGLTMDEADATVRMSATDQHYFTELENKFMELRDEADAKLKGNDMPYYLAYFQHCFDLKPEYKDYFFVEGMIPERLRKSATRYYKKENVEKYREKFALLEPEAYKEYLKMKSTEK